MSGNLIIVCLTVVICGLLLAFCHYNETKADLSTDRFEYLVQQIEIMKRDIRLQNSITDQICKDMDIQEHDIASGFEKRDREILNHERRLQILASEVFTDEEINSALDAVISGN